MQGLLESTDPCDTEGWDPYVSEEMLPSVSLKILTA